MLAAALKRASKLAKKLAGRRAVVVALVVAALVAAAWWAGRGRPVAYDRYERLSDPQYTTREYKGNGVWKCPAGYDDTGKTWGDDGKEGAKQCLRQTGKPSPAGSSSTKSMGQPSGKPSGNPADAEFTDKDWRFVGTQGSCNYYYSALRKPDGKVKCKSWTSATGINPSNNEGLATRAKSYYCTVSTGKKTSAKDCVQKAWGAVWVDRQAGGSDEARYKARGDGWKFKGGHAPRDGTVA